MITKHLAHKTFLYFLLVLSLMLCACNKVADIIQETYVMIDNASEVADDNNDIYTLPASFGFYKGSKNMSYIQTITFSRIRPDLYDECWSANLANTEHIMGYLIDNDVVIVGNCIYANKRCSNMFAGYNQYGEKLWSNLTSINGLELLDVSNVENMTTMFARSKLININGISEWNVSNVKTFAGMFQGSDDAGDVKFQYLDVEKWDTSSAINMSHMFYGCAREVMVRVQL